MLLILSFGAISGWTACLYSSQFICTKLNRNILQNHLGQQGIIFFVSLPSTKWGKMNRKKTYGSHIPICPCWVSYATTSVIGGGWGRRGTGKRGNTPITIITLYYNKIMKVGSFKNLSKLCHSWRLMVMKLMNMIWFHSGGFLIKSSI